MKTNLKQIGSNMTDTETNGQNFCNFCDWRKDCDSVVCSCNGQKRKDGVNVVFKKI